MVSCGVGCIDCFGCGPCSEDIKDINMLKMRTFFRQGDLDAVPTGSQS